MPNYLLNNLKILNSVNYLLFPSFRELALIKNNT
jgi:hypothetical protein